MTKAWSAKEIFAWNGKHYQLGMVNLWPRPIQQPHPPIWIPGSGISSTAEYVVGHDHCFCHLSYYGAKNAEQVSDRYWELVARKGRDDNPYRYSFLQLIGVAETDAEAEELYAPHAEYFFNKLLYHAASLPADSRLPGISTRWCRRCRHNPRAAINLRELKAKRFLRARLCHRRQPEDSARAAIGRQSSRLAHRASADASAFRLDADRTLQDATSTCSRARCCRISPTCGRIEYEDRWWPERLRAKRPVAAVMAAAS